MCDMCPEKRDLNRIDLEIKQAERILTDTAKWLERLDLERRHYIAKGFVE